jgi:hypothetical protein
MIRGKTKSCPFGLPITKGCKCAGEAIASMHPVEGAEDSEKAQIKSSNKALLFSHLSDSCGTCPFADAIYEKTGTVDCKWQEGERPIPAGSVGLQGSPLYPNTYVGEMPKPLYSNFPDSEYTDDNIHHTYLGLLSFYG